MDNKFTRIGMQAMIALIFFGASYASSALENISVQEGLAACNAWCNAHNTTSNSRQQCYDACYVYWECNGSNATFYSCQAAKEVTGIAEATQGNSTPPPSQATPPQVSPVVNRAPVSTVVAPTSTSTSTSNPTNRAASTAVSSTLIK